MKIILYSVPLFFILISLELIVEKARGTSYYRLNDAIASLMTGILNQTMDGFKKLIPFTLYVVFFQLFAIWALPKTLVVWCIAFILYDFFYYWNHRFGHEMNILWAAHVVHHSSEEYNLTTALRQTGTGFLSVFFYLPMAIIGFDPLMVISVGALNLVYQFWVHTRHIDKLGWFDRVFVTPSNHRVHHAQNDVYIDKNYGGVFILWDRLFGTFQEELDHDLPVYGIRGALQSWNPVKANLQIYSQLAQDCRHTSNCLYKLTLWFRRTGWRPPDVIDKYPLQKNDLSNFKKFDTKLDLPEKLYSAAQYLLMTGVALFLILNIENLNTAIQLSIIMFLIFCGYSLGEFMEKKPQRWVLEFCKFILSALLYAYI